MILAWLLLLTGLTISAVAIYYSVVGLTAIFSAAVVPIIVMGSALEIAKLVCASWLKANWERAPRFMKAYMTSAVVVLMLITSMGIFGFLSKAHNDQNLVSGDVQSKISIYDEKIKTAKDNIESDRKQLKQMDEAVDQVMGRSSDEKGADKAVAIRRSQAKDRAALAKDIEANQKLISALNDEAAPIRAEVRKVEAEVGPIKYIAKFIYGEQGADENMLEKAVTWIIILIVVVFDPLAVIMLLGAQMTFGWHNKNHDPLAEEDEYLLHETVPHNAFVADVGEPPTEEEKSEIKDWPFPTPYHSLEEEKEQHDVEENIAEEVQEETPAKTTLLSDVLDAQPATPSNGTTMLSDVLSTPDTALAQWNAMIAEAEAEAAKDNEAGMQERIATGESYIDGDGNEVKLSPDFPQQDLERPGDYLTPPTEEDSKKKTYMTKDETGHIQVKNRS